MTIYPSKRLRNLPRTHGVAVRHADKSGKAVLTNLDDDNTDILEKLEDRNYYDQVQDDPSDETKDEIEAWATKYNEGAIYDEILKFITDVGETEAAKTKPLIKIHKPVNPATGRFKTCIHQLTPLQGICPNLYS